MGINALIHNYQSWDFNDEMRNALNLILLKVSERMKLGLDGPVQKYLNEGTGQCRWHDPCIEQTQLLSKAPRWIHVYGLHFMCYRHLRSLHQCPLLQIFAAVLRVPYFLKIQRELELTMSLHWVRVMPTAPRASYFLRHTACPYHLLPSTNKFSWHPFPWRKFHRAQSAENYQTFPRCSLSWSLVEFSRLKHDTYIGSFRWGWHLVSKAESEHLRSPLLNIRKQILMVSPNRQKCGNFTPVYTQQSAQCPPRYTSKMVLQDV